jgi:predicted nucleic acid-binding protein
MGREIDQGEAEAIGLALEVEAQDVLIDEHEGREIAKSFGLSPLGILGIILREKRDGGLVSASEAMNELREKAGFFINENLYRQVVQAAEEE